MTWEVAVEFRGSPTHGMGVFACERVKKGSIVWTVDQSMHVCKQEELQQYKPDILRAALLAGYLHEPSQRFVWYTDGMQFVNHAPGLQANIGTPEWLPLYEDHVIATRDIEPGAELFEDYGFWNIFNLPREHWLRLLYRDACPQHYDFMRSLVEERVAA